MTRTSLRQRAANLANSLAFVAALPIILAAAAGMQLALRTNAGNDIVARNIGLDVVGIGGTATGSGASSLTDSGAAWATNAFAGHVVVAGSVYGIVVSNTGTVLTVDRWYTAATPGGAAGATPGTTATYCILPGGHPAPFMGLTANATAASASSTSLTAEITTSSGGLIRKICPYAHTAAATTYTLTPVFTANGSDSLPVTIAKIGVFTSMVVANTTSTMLFETLLSATATLSASGDQLTVTETVTIT